MESAFFVALLGGLLELSYLAEALFASARIPAPVLLIFSDVALGPLLRIGPERGSRLQAVPAQPGAG